MKKFLTFVLVLAMVMSVSSFAMAAGNADDLQAAINNTAVGGTLELQDDYVLGTSHVTIGKDMTIDLNGRTISSTGNTTILVDSGSLSVTDSSDGPGGTIKNTSSNGDAVAVKNNGSFDMNKGNIESSAYGIYVYDSVTSGTINISGGSIKAEKEALAVSGGTATISGGKFTSGQHWCVCDWDPGTLTVTGGTFSSDVVRDNFRAWDCSVKENEDGTFTVYKMGKNIYIGDTAYTTLEQAFEAAEENDIITITAPGEYVWPNTPIRAGVTVKGTVDGVVATSQGDTTTINATTLTVDNIDFEETFKAAFVGNGTASDLTFKDCSFTGTYAFHVDAAAADSVFTFENCEFNGFTTFAYTVGEIIVTDGEINGAFVVRQDTVIDGTEFSEDAVVQLGTDTDSVENVEVTITEDCTVKDTDGDTPELTDLIITDVNAEEGKGNSVVVGEEVVIGSAKKHTATFDTNPADAAIVVKDSADDEVSANSAGTYDVENGKTYTYTVSKDGFTAKSGEFTVKGKDLTIKVNLEEVKPASSGSGISVKYNGGNSFSTSNPSVPTGVEIDGVPVTFNGTGSNFSVGCISSDAKWVTVRWNSTSVTTNFTPDGLVECTTVSIPKTGDMSIWAAIAQFLGF